MCMVIPNVLLLVLIVMVIPDFIIYYAGADVGIQYKGRLILGFVTHDETYTIYLYILRCFDTMFKIISVDEI
jgi:hypothetical protein